VEDIVEAAVEMAATVEEAVEEAAAVEVVVAEETVEEMVEEMVEETVEVDNHPQLEEATPAMAIPTVKVEVLQLHLLMSLPLLELLPLALREAIMVAAAARHQVCKVR
jgi:hypothetical protein